MKMIQQWKDYQIIRLIGIFAFGLIGLCNGTVPNCAYHLNGVMYPNTLDCSTFWVCEYERATLVQCDEGLLYDPQLKVCNWWYAVECGETPTAVPKPETTPAPELETTVAPEAETTTSPEHTTIVHPGTYPDCENANGQIYYPHLTDPSKYFICVGTFPIELQCPAAFLWYQEYTSCVSTEIPEENCSHNEYSPHPEDEQFYYQCIDGKPVLSLCPSTLKWNQDILKCSVESATQPPYPNCNNTDEQLFFPHLIDETKYYFCAGIYPVEISCPAEFKWYQMYERCIQINFPESAEELIDCSKEQYVAHPVDDQMYFECIDNKPIIAVCPSDFKWDQELLQCIRETPDEVRYPQCHNPTGQIYFPHLTDVSKYYICAGGFAIELTCPATFYWYQEYQSCAKPELPEGEEEIIDCKSNEQQYAPHAHNEQIYYRCIGETTMQMVCPGNLRWNQELSKCTDEEPASQYPQCDNVSGQIYFPHLTDPIKYYICVGVVSIELSCPTNFLWNQDYQSCVRTDTPESEEEPIDCSLIDGPQYSTHPENDQLYYHCIDEKPIQMLCPSDLVWNQELLKCANELPAPKYPQCDNTNGQIYFEHLTDSSKYYICVGDFALELSCPSGFLWAQDYQSCARTDNSEEEIDVIDCSLENGPQSAPHETEEFYYLCIAEKPILMLCPSDLKWDNVIKKCTDEVTPEPVYPQCNNPSGQIYFPHLTDFSKYYICAGDYPIELSCPTGFLWSQNHQSCARTETPPEEEEIIDCALEGAPQSAPYEEDDQFYYLCISERPILMLCPSDLKWDQVQQICTDEVTIEPEYPQCNNPTGQIFFPHLTDSSKYYICAGEFSIELPCPSGFLWRQDHQSCARTETPEEEENIIDCLLENGPQSTAYPGNEQYYYLCIEERPVLLICPSDLKWDQNLEICTEAITIEPEYPQCDNSDDQIYFAHLTNFNQYFICAGGIPIVLSCPTNYVWNQEFQSCLSEESPNEEYPLECDKTDSAKHMSHPADTQKYFVCVNRRPALMHCPSNGIWDDGLGKCLLQIVVEPSYPPCGNGPIFYPHLTDAEKYYLCSGDYALVMSCPNNYIWSTEVNSCVEDIAPTNEPDCTNANGKTMLAHPSNPKKYYICLGTTALEMECPGETLWDETKDSCSAIEPIYPDCGGDEEFFAHLTENDQYYKCIDGNPNLMACNDDYIWDTNSNACISNKPVPTTEPESICIESGTFVPHPTDITKYYACIGSPVISIPLSCTGNTFWMRSLERCASPDMSNLPSVPSIAFPEPDCSNGDAFLSNYENCHKYYICIGGILPMEFTCEKDTYWDPINARCADDNSNCFLK